MEARVLWCVCVWVLDDPPARLAVTKREKDATNKCRMVCVELPASWTQESEKSIDEEQAQAGTVLCLVWTDRSDTSMSWDQEREMHQGRDENK